MMYGYIYLTENLINGKKYIGQHRHETFDEKYYGSGVLLGKAIDKYGKENFKVTLICECFSEEELNAQERLFIEQHDAVKSTEYYNIADGGFNANNLAGKSAEEIADIVARWKTSMNSRSEEEKQKTYEQWIRALNNVSPEEKKIRKQRYSEASRTVQAQRSPEKEKERIQKILQTRQNKSDEEKVITSKKHTAANNKMWAEMTPEKLAERTRKYKETRAKRTELDKQITAQKLSTSLRIARENTPPEEFARRYKKRKETWAAKSAEEKAAFSENCSKRSRGKIWIHNHSSEILIKPEQLDEYVINGYIRGRKNRR